MGKCPLEVWEVQVTCCWLELAWGFEALVLDDIQIQVERVGFGADWLPFR